MFKQVITYDTTAKAEILAEALPYIREFSGRIVVVKYGGNALAGSKSGADDVDPLEERERGARGQDAMGGPQGGDSGVPGPERLRRRLDGR